MDVTDINKLASRKKINADAERLREKVSRETAKIIKLKVAQDTAYWDVKEKLSQTERTRERLQQNMVDVQMQLEAASARLQHELRARPDTLNKVSGTRDMCDALEAYGERLRRGVARCRADQAALRDAYRAAAARLRTRAAAAARHRLRAALLARQHAAALAGEARRREEAEARRDELAAARADLAAGLDACARRVRQRDEALAALREEAARLARDRDARLERMQQTIAARDHELGEAAAQRAALQEALAEARRGRDELAGEAAAERERARADLQDARTTIEEINRKLEILTEDNKRLEKVISDKNQEAETIMTEMNTVKGYVANVETEKLELQQRLDETRREADSKGVEISALTRGTLALQQKITDNEAMFNSQYEEWQRRASSLEAAAAARDRELQDKAGAIARLMSELSGETDARQRADAAHAALRRRADAERDDAATRRAALETALAGKEDELRAQMTIILEMRTEKERLQERIGGMQNTIDNIQKELTGRDAAPRAAGERPHEARAAEAGAAGAAGTRGDGMLYGFLSDGSVDGDALDAKEVGRRFEALARGDMAPPQDQKTISLSQMKSALKIKNRTFFKNKRLDGKLKKNK